MSQKMIEHSVRYLQSDAAIKSVEADPYWPKWDSPWWHMLLLHEMEETHKIPERLMKAYIASLNRIPLKTFPIQPEDMPEGVDPYRGSPCHCQLGNVYQVLAKWGVDVDRELPWIRPWFLKYQMADGGLNCDSDAYLVKNEVPSSMVGTIAAFEAILHYTPREWTSEERAFLDRGAKFLINRKLMLGSSTNYNSSERKSAEEWTKLCFPRFYLYDVLRGLTALLAWSEKTKQVIPISAIADVIRLMEEQFPGGGVRIGRHSYAGAGTILQSPSGEWLRRQPASLYPLLEKVSELGTVSPFLSAHWAEAKRLLNRQGLLAESV